MRIVIATLAGLLVVAAVTIAFLIGRSSSPAATTAPAPVSPKYGWALVLEKSFATDMNTVYHLKFKIPVRSRFRIEAETPVSVALLSSVPGTGPETVAALERAACSRVNLLKDSLECGSPATPFLVVYDTRGVNSALAAIGNALKLDVPAAKKEIEPKRVSIAMDEWRCIENCP